MAGPLKTMLVKVFSFLTKETVGFEMDDKSSIDIDSDLDWIIAEQILKNKLGSI